MFDRGLQASVWLTAEFFTALWSNLWLGAESPRPDSLSSILHPRPFISVLVAVLPRPVSGEYSFTINLESSYFASGTFFRKVSRKPAGKGSLFSSIARFALTHASEYRSCSYRENAHSRQLRA